MPNFTSTLFRNSSSVTGTAVNPPSSHRVLNAATASDLSQDNSSSGCLSCTPESASASQSPLTSPDLVVPAAAAAATAAAAPADAAAESSAASAATSAAAAGAATDGAGYLSFNGRIPHHLAIIMDGNGRWAQQRGRIRLMGHRQGAKAVTRTVEAAVRYGVKVLTLFAFSSENWKRPQDEVSGLMNLFAQVLQSERERLHKNGIKVKVVGDLSRFSDKLRRAISSCEELTCNNTAMLLNIAVNYGGRWDVVQAARKLCAEVQAGTLNPEDISEDRFQKELAVFDDVDLMIRTGGECRISNFLLYQCAYSELFITHTLWPDFDQSDLEQAFIYFNSRERRFGMTSEQVKHRPS